MSHYLPPRVRTARLFGAAASSGSSGASAAGAAACDLAFAFAEFLFGCGASFAFGIGMLLERDSSVRHSCPLSSGSKPDINILVGKKQL